MNTCTECGTYGIAPDLVACPHCGWEKLSAPDASAPVAPTPEPPAPDVPAAPTED